MSVSHTVVGAGAVLTGGPALSRSGLFQLYQGPHHGRQSAGRLSPTGALLLVSGRRQGLFALGRRRTPAEQDLSKSPQILENIHKSMKIKLTSSCLQRRRRPRSSQLRMTHHLTDAATFCGRSTGLFEGTVTSCRCSADRTETSSA